MPLLTPKAVTFDCWQTLMVEVDSAQARDARLRALRHIAGEAGRGLSNDGAEQVLAAARRRHWQLSQHSQLSQLSQRGSNQRGASSPSSIARWSLASLKLPASVIDALLPELEVSFAEAALGSEVVALSGARESLLKLERAGIRRGLICDTGFTPGRVVRQLLTRLELLELLEVHVFSDELGVLKPHARMFEHALRALDCDPADAVHVGDLRRTDIAGARAMGMRSVRMRNSNDDTSPHPEADEVADSHAQLCTILGV